MKKTFLFLTLAVLMSVAAFAADSGTGKIHLTSAVKVGSVELPAGEYKVSWTGTGDNAQVSLKQGKVSTTTTARVVDVKRPSNAFVVKNDNGARVLSEIQFEDKTLVLNPAEATATGR